MVIRPAEEVDFPAVTRLLEQVGRPLVTPRTRATVKETYLQQLLDPDADHLVAVTDRGVVIGFCSLHFRTRLNRTAPQAWIPDLVVDEGRRGRGVARALLEAAENRARARGCLDLTLESSYERGEAHVLYAGAGMKDAGKFFRKQVAEPPEG